MKKIFLTVESAGNAENAEKEMPRSVTQRKGFFVPEERNILSPGRQSVGRKRVWLAESRQGWHKVMSPLAGFPWDVGRRLTHGLTSGAEDVSLLTEL